MSGAINYYFNIILYINLNHFIYIGRSYNEIEMFLL